MGDFEDLRGQLADHRAERETRRTASLVAAGAVTSAERQLTATRRTADDAAPELLAAQGHHAAAVRAAEAAAADLREVETVAASTLEALSAFTDPVENIGRLSDQSPILLFPLRLETRFKQSAAGTPQLWVRIYPDTCLVDGFESSLTAAEIDNGTAFWAAVWRACGDEGLERAAWRELVAASGAGRAGWVLRQLVPKNPGDKPIHDTTVLRLILMATAAQPAAASDYWAAVWTAQGDVGALAQARADLTAALGAAEAERVQANPPANLADRPTAPLTPADVTAKVSVLQLADAAELGARASSWSSAPRVDLLPDRFVLLGYESGGAAPRVELGRPIAGPLVVGPDPEAAPTDQLKPVGDDPDHPDTLQIPDDLRWMFDFQRALEVGMALRFDLTPAQAREGFARLMVLGVRLSETAAAGADGLAQLVEHQLYSRTGLELLPQGTPTNNSEQGGSGHSWRQDPDSSFGLFFKQEVEYARESSVLQRRDGQNLADALALPDELVARIPHAGLTDRLEAHAMQIALWPATIGYLMDSMLAPVFSDATVAATREFFTRQVSGRGPLPALRIGMQPYGIQPVVAFDRLGWFGPRPRGDLPPGQALAGHVARLVRQVESEWRPLLSQVSQLGDGGADGHQTLLDVLGLHPTSVEYYPLTADSLEHKAYEVSLFGTAILELLIDRFPPKDALALLRRLGYDGEQVPDLLTKLYRARRKPLDGPLIDAVPLSETDPIRASAAGRNYIQWLTDAAELGIAALQGEQGFDDGRRPAALLYLLLRHALQLSFRETAVDLRAGAGTLADKAVLRREPPFVHVTAEAEGALPQLGSQPGLANDRGPASESRYAVLFTPDVAVTGDVDLSVGDFIARNVRELSGPLPEQMEALDLLGTLPTARLERLFAEHIDTVSYRLDAWKTGVLALGLQQLRGPSTKGRGTYLGAYGWVEDLRPEGKVLSPVKLPPDLAAEVDRHDTLPLLRDPTNLGLVHAPSINHAATAAVLRNAHVAHEGTMTVNLSSRRVRAALDVLEGMRGGQSLGALLGYRLERYVHDNGPLTVRSFVYPLRREYPLAANQIQATATDEGEAHEAIAAMNVIDGRSLILAVATTGQAVYPFANPRLPRGTEAEEEVLTDGVRHIRDVNDAVADLVLAEGVHQAVLGNYDRSAATLDAFAKGSHPPEPEVVRTPRSGTTLTLRTAVHLPVTGPDNPIPALAMTPLARIDPGLNRWVTSRLPSPDDVAVSVSFVDRATGLGANSVITQASLGLHAVDLLYRAEPKPEQALSDLDDRILERLHATEAVSHDQPVTIRHTQRINGKVSFFELEGVLRSLRRVLVGSRSLRPADLVRQGDARSDDQATSVLPRSRVAAARQDLHDVQLAALHALTAVVDDGTKTIEQVIKAYAETVRSVAAYRISQAGTGFAYEWRAARYAALTDLVAARVAAWDERIARHEQLLLDYVALPGTATVEERLQILRTAEVLVSTTVSSEPSPAALRALLTTEGGAFVAKRNALHQLATVPRSTLAGLVADTLAASDVSAFDPEALDLSGEVAEVARFRADLRHRVDLLVADVGHRIVAVDEVLAAHDVAAAADRAGLLQDGGRAIFGEDIVMAPQITLPAAAAAELAKAWAHSKSGGLTQHLTDPPPAGSGRDFVEEDWLHGIARVRDKLHHLENVVLLSAALPGASAPELTPVQLPHEDGQPWLGLEIPAGIEIDSDRLLYTSVFAGAYDPTQPLCGLLVDEWTEVIPAREQTTGVAFHHDRPNAEPPQAWLLALPAVVDGAWSWDDLVGAVTDALDSAKLRALEPTHLDTTPYDALLPATHSAWTYPEISISNNLLRNVGIYARLAEEG